MAKSILGAQYDTKDDAYKRRQAALAQEQLDAALSKFNQYGEAAVKTLKNVHATPDQTRIALANVRQICKLDSSIAVLKRRRDLYTVAPLTTPVPTVSHLPAQHPGFAKPKSSAVKQPSLLPLGVKS